MADYELPRMSMKSPGKKISVINMNEKNYEVIILGTGPAGLQAAIHAARAKVSVLVLGRPEQSSIYRAHIENYCCMSNISGDDLLASGIAQARKFGAEFLGEDVVETKQDGAAFTVRTESGGEVRAAAVIFTMGITRNSLNVPGENTLKGHGVSYCVDCDANFFKGKPVAIIGNGSAAGSGALTLAAYTDTVHLVSRGLTVNEALMEKLKKSIVRLHDDCSVTEIIGPGSVEKIRLSTGEELAVEGVFIELGAKGALELAGFLGIQMDDNLKHIATNKKQETNIPGIYAAGDICGPPWQIAKAVGEGCVAGLEAAAYVKKLRA